jgi:DNA uptake protein ComE-like DNA-binding protein
MCMASEQDWREIDGIGKTLAKRIVEELEGK